MTWGIDIIMMRQDDPSKCTAARMVRFGLARTVRRAPRHRITLNPYAAGMLLPQDMHKGICAIDCSWRLAGKQFRHAQNDRKLPPLLAGNPVNYSKVGKLTTAEAIAAALYIMGRKDDASKILDKFRWGHTFLELNTGLLDEYCMAQSPEEMWRISESYGLPGEYQIL